jgi:hypothetical protein
MPLPTGMGDGDTNVGDTDIRGCVWLFVNVGDTNDDSRGRLNVVDTVGLNVGDTEWHDVVDTEWLVCVCLPVDVADTDRGTV